MKITHLIFSFNTGGAETMLVDIVNEQILKADVSIIIINNNYNQALLNKIDKRIKVFFTNRSERSKNPLPIIKLNILLFKLNSDVLHCHNHNIAPLLFYNFRKKMNLTVHDVNVETKYFKLYNKLFAISKIVKSDIYKNSNMNAILVYNGICTKLVQQKTNFNIGKSFKIIIVSRLRHEKKGQHIAIEALKSLKKKGITNIKLDLIGEGPSELYLKKLVEENGLNNDINFIGLKDKNYIYNHLKDYELLIQPSFYEGFGLTVLEGMVAKVPVLVSNIDGPMEIIDYGEYGYSFEVGNAENLADQIKNIQLNYTQQEFKKKVQDAYQIVKLDFDISKTASEYLRLY
jgi:glycosyltransferase involved in cell wall biosynthesis